jgi:hypothetical protein
VVEDLVGDKWGPSDLLPVNPSGDELQSMREALLLKRTAERAAKKDKKAVKDKAANGCSTVAAGAKRPAAGNGAAAVAASGGVSSAADGANGAAANGANGTAKRFKAAELKPSGADEKVWASLFTSSKKKGTGNDYMTRGVPRYICE